QLDQKLWVALACPATGIQFDAKTLALIATDKDGRLRAPEVIAAAKWVAGLLQNPDDLLKSSPALPLSAINDSTAEGRQLFSSAKQILANLGKQDCPAISVEETTDTAKIFAQTRFNGDGIIPVDAAGDEATKVVLNEIITCLGAETDRSGKPGVNQLKADQFFAEAQAFSDWWKKAEGDANILPIGEATATAAGAVRAVKAKVDDYFARCRLAAFDPRALAAVNRQESEYLAVAAKDMTISASEVSGFPLARVEPGRPLPLKEGVNPAWAGAMATLQSAAVKTLIGERTVLTEADWIALLARLGPYENWFAGKVGANVEKLGIKRVREILAGTTKDGIAALIARDRALEPEANAIAAVDKLVRYHRDLFTLLNNFVTFRDFYTRRNAAVFQAGTLFLDARSCELCIMVADAGKHTSMAGMAGAYLAYCDCVRKATGEKIQIVAAFTDGDSDNLMVGRNGIFYDRSGRDWDATITKIVDNPISLRQAFWSPYKKFVRLIEEQIAKRAAVADAASTAQLQSTAASVAQADQVKAAPPAQKKMDVGTVAALGVAFGAIGAFLTALWANMMGIIRLGPLAIVGAFIGLLVLISGPALVLAFIKLRKRNLAPILDANG
ncbi:MAG TPA: hypothetical protein VFR76_11285, partial [Verrucomicrobiae bacterium]|nr:hypothetical protein [Verrucomicrobiae bacterium]